MKKLYIILLLIYGCDITRPNTITTKEHDSCEYIIWNGNDKGGIIHKENCKFCKLRKLK